MWLLILLGLASAGELQDFPWSTEVSVAETGVSRIRIGPDLRSSADPIDGSDFMLINGVGESVPFAVRRGGEPPVSVSAIRGSKNSRFSVAYWPDKDPGSWSILINDRPFDALEVTLPDRPLAATATLTRDGDTTPLTTALIWNLSSGSNAELPVPAETGLFHLKLKYHGDSQSRDPSINALRWDGSRIKDDVVTLPVEAPWLQEDSWVRYDVPLPHAYPITRVVLKPEDGLFERNAEVLIPPIMAGPETLPGDVWHNRSAVIRRSAIGGASIEQTKLDLSARPNKRVIVYIEAVSRPTLALPSVEARFPGVELLVRDPGAGPFTLYAGAPSGTTHTSDLQFAAADLARVASTDELADKRSPNPAYSPPEVRSGLGNAGTEIELGRFKWSHTVQGQGLSRVALSPEVLANAKPDLSDLRLVDSEGRQIPYVLRGEGVRKSWGELPMERNERDGVSYIRATLPVENMIVGSVTVKTDAPKFSRRVTISRPRGGELETVRAFNWMGDDSSRALTLDVNRRFGDELVVSIDNGDNPPLEISSIEASWPIWELIAVLPEADVELVYGDRRLAAPDYDLSMLTNELRRRADSEGTLGEQAELRPPTLSFAEQAVLAFGVGFMGLGLFGLTIVLIREVGGDEPEEEDEVSEDDQAAEDDQAVGRSAEADSAQADKEPSDEP